MLETGRACLACDTKKYLKNFTQTKEVCDQCVNEFWIEDAHEQVRLKNKYEKFNPKIGKCDCGRFYIKNKTFRSCNLCRNSGIKTKKDSTGMTGATDHSSQLKREKLEEENEIKRDSKNQKTEKPQEQEVKNTIKKIKSERSQGKEIMSEKIERNTMQDKELTTTETEGDSYNQSTEQESEETQPTVYQNLPENLSQENSNSIKLLDESARLLTKSAESLMNKNSHIDDETGETIKSISVSDVDSLVKLTMGANELMKTKLSYIRAGKDIIKDFYE